MVQSQTGSGKTGAFLLPMLHRIDPALGAPQALVLAPTRELAVQVARDAEELGRSMGIRSLPIYGGMGYAAQIQGLEAGAQLIIGTPGRILDHLLKGTLTLDWLKILVFDEADRMLSMGFYPDMKQLQRYLPRGLQSAMFSATYPGHVKRLAQQFLREPRFVSLSQTQVHATDVLHVIYNLSVRPRRARALRDRVAHHPRRRQRGQGVYSPRHVRLAGAWRGARDLSRPRAHEAHGLRLPPLGATLLLGLDPTA